MIAAIAQLHNIIIPYFQTMNTIMLSTSIFSLVHILETILVEVKQPLPVQAVPDMNVDSTQVSTGWEW